MKLKISENFWDLDLDTDFGNFLTRSSVWYMVVMENKCNQKHLQADIGILQILQIYLNHSSDPPSFF